MEKRFYTHSSGSNVVFSVIKTGGCILASCGNGVPSLYLIDDSVSPSIIKYIGSGSQLSFREYGNRLYVIQGLYTTTDILSVGANADASVETIMKKTWNMPSEIQDNWVNVTAEPL